MQPLKRLAHRRSADPEVTGDLLLAGPLTASDAALGNCIAQGLINEIGPRARAQDQRIHSHQGACLEGIGHGSLSIECCIFHFTALCLRLYTEEYKVAPSDGTGGATDDTRGSRGMRKKLVLETTAPFQGLAELVAYDEGLFEKEGVTIEWIDREKGVDKSPQLHITSHKDAPRFASHGSQLEQGKADLYNACEWGNYSRVEGTNVASRQIGRRSIVTYAALVVRAESPVQTPQQFANRQIGVPFYNGTHYLAIQMLEGFVPRDQIKLGRVPNGSPYRFKMLMDGTIDATTLTEPYISLAE